MGGVAELFHCTSYMSFPFYFGSIHRSTGRPTCVEELNSEPPNNEASFLPYLAGWAHPSTQSPGEQSCWPIFNYNLILLIKIYSSKYVTSEDFADVDVCTKLDSNQPTMRPPKPLGWNTEKESSGGFLAASPLASLHDYHFVWKHSFCSQLQDKKKVSSPYYTGNDRLLWQKAHVWPADLLLYYLHHWCQSKWVLI